MITLPVTRKRVPRYISLLQLFTTFSSCQCNLHIDTIAIAGVPGCEIFVRLSRGYIYMHNNLAVRDCIETSTLCSGHPKTARAVSDACLRTYRYMPDFLALHRWNATNGKLDLLTESPCSHRISRVRYNSRVSREVRGHRYNTILSLSRNEILFPF